MRAKEQLAAEHEPENRYVVVTADSDPSRSMHFDAAVTPLEAFRSIEITNLLIRKVDFALEVQQCFPIASRPRHTVATGELRLIEQRLALLLMEI
ncbi:MAG: hypothetical protein IPF83_13290 [Rhodanobacteraceae bacterium]|nr:hypothetical protein [Rhodanobacteraceae bacterium]